MWLRKVILRVGVITSSHSIFADFSLVFMLVHFYVLRVQNPFKVTLVIKVILEIIKVLRSSCDGVPLKLILKNLRRSSFSWRTDRMILLSLLVQMVGQYLLLLYYSIQTRSSLCMLVKKIIDLLFSRLVRFGLAKRDFTAGWLRPAAEKIDTPATITQLKK